MSDLFEGWGTASFYFEEGDIPISDTEFANMGEFQELLEEADEDTQNRIEGEETQLGMAVHCRNPQGISVVFVISDVDKFVEEDPEGRYAQFKCLVLDPINAAIERKATAPVAEV